MNRCDKASKQSLQTRASSPAAPTPALDLDRAQHTAVWAAAPPPAQPPWFWTLECGPRGRWAMFGVRVLRPNKTVGKGGNRTQLNPLLSVLLLL